MIDLVEKKIRKRLKDEHFLEILKQTSVTFVFRTVGILAGYIFYFLISRYYGSTVMGAFSLSLTVLSIFTVMGRLGIDTSIIKYFAQNAALNKWDVILEVYQKVLKIVVPAGIFLSIILFSISSLLADLVFHKPNLAPYFRITSFAVLPMILRFINSESYRGFKMNKEYAWSKNVSYYLYAAVLLGILTVFSKHAFLPNICFAASLVFLGITSSRFVLRKIHSHEKVASSEITVPEILKTSFPMMLSSSMTLLSGWINMIILGIYANESQVGIFSVVLKVSTFSTFILTSINSVAAPQFAERKALNDHKGLAKVSRNAARLNFWASLPLLVGIIVFRKPILTLFGSEFEEGADLLYYTMVGQFINVFSGNVGIFLNMTGHQKAFQNIIAISTAGSIFTGLICIPQFGMTGSAITNMVFLVILNVSAVLYIRFKLGYKTFYFPGFK